MSFLFEGVTEKLKQIPFFITTMTSLKTKIGLILELNTPPFSIRKKDMIKLYNSCVYPN
jgi:hypothetical protein